jgi:hypothetical protein
MLSRLLSYIAITFPSLECAARRSDTRADSLFVTASAVSAADAGLADGPLEAGNAGAADHAKLAAALIWVSLDGLAQAGDEVTNSRRKRCGDCI